jgi:hypothetical protein
MEPSVGSFKCAPLTLNILNLLDSMVCVCVMLCCVQNLVVETAAYETPEALKSVELEVLEGGQGEAMPDSVLRSKVRRSCSSLPVRWLLTIEMRRGGGGEGGGAGSRGTL